jgi:methionine aminopeptidase
MYYNLGIAFPVCISANSCICHFSPITSEPDHTIAKDDVLKMYVIMIKTIKYIDLANELILIF